MSLPGATLPAKTYTAYILRKGDNDQVHRWGGVHISNAGGTPVRDLQTALATVGAYDRKVDGDFGKWTDTAVRRFQWNLRNLRYRLVHGNLQAVSPNPAIVINGTADAATRTELQNWVAGSVVTTGNLVRAKVSAYANFQNGFKLIPHPSITGDDIVVDADFVPRLRLLNDRAQTANVDLIITQAFRVQGAPVSGAVVQPATHSQHLIGHAIDCNILDGDTRINSDAFAKGEETDAADLFVNNVKAAGLRWGGDFTPVDYVHFDDYVAPHSDAYEMRFYFNQRMISLRQPIPAA